ncbi:MAG: hypothetical protein Q7S57_00575 [bacterium]|nr:hypothetical protein [bacterium]
MKNKKIAFDTIIRLTGSLCLVLAVLFWIPGLQNRTIGGVFLWISILASIVGIVGSYFGKRSWYSGVLLLATYLFVISRYNPNQVMQFIVMVLVLFVAFGGLTNNFIKRVYSKRLFIKKIT